MNVITNHKFTHTQKLFEKIHAKTNMNQAQIAKALGLKSAQYVHNVVHGRAPIAAKYWRILAKISGVPEKEFFKVHMAEEKIKVTRKQKK